MSIATRAVFSEAWKKLGVRRKARGSWLSSNCGLGGREEKNLRWDQQMKLSIKKTCLAGLDHEVFSASQQHKGLTMGSWCINMLMTASLSEINALIVCMEQPFVIPWDMKICWRFFRASRWHSSYKIYLFYGFEALSDTYQRPFHASTMHNIFCNSS